VPVDLFVLLVLGLVLVAAVAGTVAYATAHAIRRPAPAGEDDGQTTDTGHRDRQRQEPREPDRGPAQQGRTTDADAGVVRPTDSRLVARVVAFLYLASVAMVVALTGAWPETEAVIFTLLATGTLLVVLFLDMLPKGALGRARRPVEGVGAVLFVGILVALTGGTQSPFFVGFFLVVAGTALTIEGNAPLLIALLASATLAFAAVVAAGMDALTPESLGWIGFNAVALILLADIAAAAGRAQRQARDDAIRASRFDPLTGLFNRSYFLSVIEHEIRRSARMSRRFSMLMLDLDDLKPVNDTFGHQAGDRLLRAVADVIANTVRFTDSGARYGGDEFVVLLPETEPTGAYIVAEKLRRDIAALAMRAADRTIRSTVSIGLVAYPDDGATFEQLISAADVAMYESKRRGKNQIVGYKTRTERVPTALEIEAPALVSLGPEAKAVEGASPPDVFTTVPRLPADGEEPWLTRTEPVSEPEAQEERTGPGGSADGRDVGREPSREEEIRSSRDRPWVAMPVEQTGTPGADEPDAPDAPTDPPKRPPGRPDRPRS
jgi:diguanylate cyclase (GGDEF)-like protein